MGRRRSVAVAEMAAESAAWEWIGAAGEVAVGEGPEDELGVAAGRLGGKGRVWQRGWSNQGGGKGRSLALRGLPQPPMREPWGPRPSARGSPPGRRQSPNRSRSKRAVSYSRVWGCVQRGVEVERVSLCRWAERRRGLARRSHEAGRSWRGGSRGRLRTGTSRRGREGRASPRGVCRRRRARPGRAGRE